MIINGKGLLSAAPLSPMLDHKARAHGVSHGLTEIGYDIRVKQTIRFTPPDPLSIIALMQPAISFGSDRDRMILEAFHGYVEVDGKRTLGRVAYASTIERFEMPKNLRATVDNKSTRLRQGVLTFGKIEPGWNGHLTLELFFNGLDPVEIPAESGIAAVEFVPLSEPADYGDGKYQNQPDMPVAAIMEGEA